MMQAVTALLAMMRDLLDVMLHCRGSYFGYGGRRVGYRGCEAGYVIVVRHTN